ncbi:DUF1294 domain-containing protein [Natronincola ferrireducens]|uniref:Uncharacterized membrane protein YsdA, DUF1294 family n=1 Tax=Natronincola ferrireducens TaxID=393762 RepID=A0A1G9E6K2_9FIRM|nr:DUF1294 domain-containing protein [Natronincola ferrireducens]SDK71782.1 Uncharacterized membrane protein YsdA, DUF1294 family [Natronincola ferrireducens]
MGFAREIYGEYPTIVNFYSLYILGINIVAILLMGIDKKRAKKNQWRIKEITLLSIGLLGGAVGVLIGMVFFHHKQNKKKFYAGVPLLYIMNKIINIIIYDYWLR